MVIALLLTNIFVSYSAEASSVDAEFKEEMAGFRSTVQAFVKKSKTKQQKDCFKNELEPVINSKTFQKKLAQCIEYEKKNKGLTTKGLECTNLRFDFINKAMKKCKR